MTTEKFVLAIDQGTTSTRAIIFNHAGEIVSVGRRNSRRSSRTRWSSTTPSRSGTPLVPSSRRPCRRRRSTATTWPPWVSPTSARPRSCGIRTPASPCTTRSSGRTCVPPTSSRSLRRRGPGSFPPDLRPGPVPLLLRLEDQVDPGQRRGCSRARRGRRPLLRQHRLLGPVEPDGRRQRRRALHRRHQRLAHHAHGHSHPLLA